MPCAKCNHLLLLYDEEICPKCNQLAVLDSETAIRVGIRLVELTTKIFNEELIKWERDTLLANLAAKRELLSREYFREYGSLKAGRLAAFTLLIKRVTKFSNFRGKIPQQGGEVDKLVDTFESLREFESILLKLEAGYNNILYLNKFNENSFTLDEATRTFVVVPNETYVNFEKTFASHNIFPQKVAKQKIAEFKQADVEKIEQIEYQILTPQEFIQKHYDILNNIFVLFHRDRLSAECFDLEYFREILSEPRDLLEFISTFRLFEDDSLTVCPTGQFIKRASKYFGLSDGKAKKLLGFDVNNKSIFPLFVRFRNETLGDVVCITKDFSRFIYTILHAIITKDLFDKETVQLSKRFENEKVKTEFVDSGYIYILNITDKKKPNLEIDGLAINNNRCYVIECKGWRFPRLIDEPDTKEHIIRDLKGIALGKKYTVNRDRQLIEKDKPSLIEKIEYVKQNISSLAIKHCFNPDLTHFEGVIITIDYPPIAEFKGIKIRSINQIADLIIPSANQTIS